MAKAYLFVFNNIVGSLEDVIRVFDSRKEILNWRYDIPNVFYIVSNNSAQQLFWIVQGGLNREAPAGRFLICEVGDNKQGWLPEDTWSMLNNPKAPEAPRPSG